jgi:hypothetical protein
MQKGKFLEAEEARRDGGSENAWRGMDQPQPSAGCLQCLKLSELSGRGEKRARADKAQPCRAASVVRCATGQDRFSSWCCCIVFFVVALPHGKLAAVGQSGLHSQAGENPTIENEPDEHNAKQKKQVHDVVLQEKEVALYMKSNINARTPSSALTCSAQHDQFVHHIDHPWRIPAILLGGFLAHCRGHRSAQGHDP